MYKPALLFFLCAALVLPFFSCSRSRGEPSAYSASGMQKTVSDSYAEETIQSNEISGDFSVYSDSGAVKPVNSRPRKLVQTAYLRITAKNVAEFGKLVQVKIRESGGYIEESSLSNSPEGTVSFIDMSVKIPAENLDIFLDWIDSNAAVDEKSLRSQDVTDRYYDLDSRIKNRRILLETYRGYLASAKTMKDILDVDDRINSLTYEIEQMSGSLFSLDRSITFSTINLSIFTDGGSSSSVNPFVARLKGFGADISQFFVSAFFVFLYVAVIGTAVVLLCAFVFYLTFGKIGLIRRLFKKLK